MLLKKTLKNVGIGASLVALLTTAAVVRADAYTPFAAKLPAKQVSVKTANLIDVEAETWPGFSRSFEILLDGIQVPKNTTEASACEQELAEHAVAFVKDFLAGAKDIMIIDMKMENSGQQTAKADIETSKGSLTQALLSKGMARPDTVAPDTAWCQ
ncbi:MAG: hypothetical protein PHR16_05630 [Methylovulum sp.]|nr:hypothetical protein [Methylovulum sp.]